MADLINWWSHKQPQEKNGRFLSNIWTFSSLYSGVFYCWDELQWAAQHSWVTSGIGEIPRYKDQVQLPLTDGILVQCVGRIIWSWISKESSLDDLLGFRKERELARRVLPFTVDLCEATISAVVIIKTIYCNQLRVANENCSYQY